MTLRNFIMRFRLDSMHEVRELHRVLDEENGDIVADDVPVPFGCIKLRSESAYISYSILQTNQQNISNKRSKRVKVRTALPFDPCTVLNLTNTGVVRAESVRTGA